MPEFLYILLGILAGFVVLVVPAAIVVMGGGMAGWFLGNVTGGFFANFSTAMRLYGGAAGPQPTPLHVLEWANVEDVAEALVELTDEEIALVLARLRPRFARRIMARIPASRHEWVGYWLDRPQPFPRQAQAALARRLKRRLGIATTA